MISLGTAAIIAAVGGSITLIVALSRSRQWNADGSDDQRRQDLDDETEGA